MDQVLMPATQIPSFRTKTAIERNIETNLLFTTWGGIGDQICTEPTLRFALDSFLSSCRVSLWTEFPELFRHLPFTKIYDGKEKPDVEAHFVFQTIVAPENLVWEFASHCLTHCVDFPSICSLRCTLPIDYKAVRLPVSIDEQRTHDLQIFRDKKFVAVHAGKHWPSKTFPSDWWNEVLKQLQAAQLTPVLIGKDVSKDVGTVAVDTAGCVDLRNLCTLSETIWLLQNMNYLVCSDSSPLHMAVTGNAHIAFIASAKHHDYIYHWRRNLEGKVEWAWRMQHFNRGGMWQVVDYCPNKAQTVTVDQIDEATLRTWLPHPAEIVEWIMSREVAHD